MAIQFRRCASSRRNSNLRAFAARVLCYGSFLVLCLSAVMAQAQETLPNTPAKSLSDSNVNLPIAGKQMLIVVGFTKASSTAADAWWKKAEPLCQGDSGLVCYEAAMLESVPRFVRGMVVGSIRKGVAPGHQDTFLTIFENQAKWKPLFGYSAADDAYVALVDGQGHIVWKTHGNATAASEDMVRQGMASLRH